MSEGSASRGGPTAVSAASAVSSAASPEASSRGASSGTSGASFEAAVLVLLRHGETELTGQKRFSGSGVRGPHEGAGTDPAAVVRAARAAEVRTARARAAGARTAEVLTTEVRTAGVGGGVPGGAGPELSEAGLRQADRAAAELAARGGVQAVVSSPLARCRRTAEIAAARLGLDVTVEEGLRETDFGAWEGLTFAEARERHPAELEAWLGSESAAPPGGESFAEVARRVVACRDALLTAYRGRTILLVSHVTPIKTLLRLALGAPPASLFRMDLAPASLSEIAHYGDGNATVRQLNATAHLR